ncbi:MAG TPA: histidinol-phosphatase [Alphaproteobacteria bacterium]|nr:histidinol-phosphatase [Alphaproteobacteria bacterium]
MTEAELNEAAAFAGRLADAGGAVARQYFRQALPVETKADASPVTRADRETEAAMRALIEEHYPNDGIVGEEHGQDRAEAARLWVLDPIDGTRSFVTGVPLFGTLIALAVDGVPVVGVIDQPMTRERWVGIAGAATTLNGAPVCARDCAELRSATLSTTGEEFLAGAGELEAFNRVRAAAGAFRRVPDCYGYAMLATGFVDLVIEAALKTWDFAALRPVIEGAGGIVTDWGGRPLDLSSDGRIAAAGDARCHAQALAALDWPDEI